MIVVGLSPTIEVSACYPAVDVEDQTSFVQVKITTSNREVVEVGLSADDARALIGALEDAVRIAEGE